MEREWFFRFAATCPEGVVFQDAYIKSERASLATGLAWEGLRALPVYAKGNSWRLIMAGPVDHRFEYPRLCTWPTR